MSKNLQIPELCIRLHFHFPEIATERIPPPPQFLHSPPPLLPNHRRYHLAQREFRKLRRRQIFSLLIAIETAHLAFSHDSAVYESGEMQCFRTI